MPTHELTIVDGPIEADLMRASVHPQQQLVFRVRDDVVDARLNMVEQGPERLDFILRGRLTSGKYRGSAFSGIYHASSRTGLLSVTP